MSVKILGEIVPGLVNQIGVTSRNFTLLSFVERELAAVSPASEIVAFKNNKVYVEACSSVHLHELTLKKRALLQNIKKQLPIRETESLEIRFFLKGMARLNAEERMKWNPARKPFDKLRVASRVGPFAAQVEGPRFKKRSMESGFNN